MVGFTQELENMIVSESFGDARVAEWVREKCRETFAKKQSLIFVAQVALFVRK